MHRGSTKGPREKYIMAPNPLTARISLKTTTGAPHGAAGRSPYLRDKDGVGCVYWNGIRRRDSGRIRRRDRAVRTVRKVTSAECAISVPELVLFSVV